LAAGAGHGQRHHAVARLRRCAGAGAGPEHRPLGVCAGRRAQRPGRAGRRCAGRGRRRHGTLRASHALPRPLTGTGMDQGTPLVEIARFLRRLQWIVLALAVIWLVGMLAPVLTPFVLGALLGWLGDPLVDRLVARGRSRAAAVILVFTGMLLVLLVGLVLLVPMLERQVAILFDSRLNCRAWFVGTALPWLEARTGLELMSWLDPARLFELVREYWNQAGGAAATVLGYLSRSGFALLAWLANIV